MKTTSMLMGTVFGQPQICFAPEDEGAGGSGGEGTPPADTGTPLAGEGNPPGGGEKWYAGLAETDQGWLQNRGLHERPLNEAFSEAIKSYRNLESRMGAPADRLLKLPENLEGEEMGAVYDRLGRPEKPEGYDFKAPDNVELNENFTSWAKNTFHELGLNQAQGQALLNSYLEFEQGSATAAGEASQETLKVQEQALRKEWGAAFDQNVSAARRAARDLGVDAETIDALEKEMGYDGVLKLFNSVAGRILEPGFHDNPAGAGTPGGMAGAMTPAQAKDQINQLKGDKEFIKKYTAGDIEAKRKMDYLHSMAFPADNQPLR